ncbi:TetR family transcriptional regulator [Kribbella sandramycini]|uniref:AcrR family transcriptional regulator n=1 Tax=Kribbella sandramycini TaxID=60450 RepID=A0A7Y4L7H7_9ACTN|nr:TetR family transcriptional regulator [Kribbella sandramycini]MBB6567084.1 AcrR family transcriptional regulator [Kribbella sandramycini]NOL44802.1 TetR family transcriptional regulator [Kribbella sandramycini]
MPRTGSRGGPQTRARIAEAAAGLFLEHGFDTVTVAAVAKAAGVSSVTVFKHFPRKEDLFLDRQAEAEELLRAAVRPGGDIIGLLGDLTLRLADERHPLSGLDPASVPFFRTVAESAALTARAREIAAGLQQALTEELTPAYDGDAALLAAFFVAGYSTVLIDTARRRLTGDSMDAVADAHRARLRRLSDALRATAV